MIKKIKNLREKYRKISLSSEYVSIQEILVDLYRLEQDVRISRLSKENR